MTKEQIDKLLSYGNFPDSAKERKLIETHISWVILGDKFVYKIKKPIKYSFLDFSTPELRKHYCEKEIELNQRFSKDIYLEILPIYELQDRYGIGVNEGKIIDYAVKMRKLDPEKQMDILLVRNKVSESDIRNLAEKVAGFHKTTKSIYKKNVFDIREKFNDLGMEKEFLAKRLASEYGELIDRAIKASDTFLSENEKLLANRLNSGFFKDCHGDLHARNIFLLPNPQPFDCIEFNDDYRQIDVLNEVAFLCMDLDAMGKKGLSDLFIAHYDHLFPTIRKVAERKLFVYYKSYRANIRAKVNSLRAKSAKSKAERIKPLAEAKKYLSLMASYLKSLDTI
jgi:aminoglycoside phosphotransferase family enzyme